MEIAKIQISGVSAKIVSQKPVPAGIIGATISVEYTDPSWKNLSKTVVFTGCGTKDVLSSSNVITVPTEVVAKPGYELQVSFYGVGENQQLAVPTLRVSLGKIKPAARPSGDSSTDPSLPVWAQLQQDVNALKESSSVGGGGESGATYTPSVSEDGVLSWTNDKGLKNPPSVVIMGQTGPQGPKGDTGENGVDGADGYTPVRGTDYWTDADKAEMTDYMRDNLTAEDVGAISNNGRNVANANIAFGAITNGLIADGTISATKLADDVFSGIVKSVNGNAPDENGNVEVSGGTSTIQPLTFTGAVSATYDGSEAVSVKIPEGGGGSSGGASGWEYIDTIDLSSGALSYEFDTTGYAEIMIVNITALTFAGSAVTWKDAAKNVANGNFSLQKNIGTVYTLYYIGNGYVTYSNGRSGDTLLNTHVASGAEESNNALILTFTSVTSGTIVIAGRV